MKKWHEDIVGHAGLEYIVFKNVPMRNSNLGPVMEINPAIFDELAVRAILERKLPIRGLEVRFIRKALGMTLDAFSKKLGLTASAVQKWEKAANERILPVNEVTVKSLAAEVMAIDISGKLSTMLGSDITPKKIELKAS